MREDTGRAENEDQADRYGHGPNRIVALSGWLGDARDWRYVVEALDPSVFSFLLFDYGGYGRRRGMVGPYTFAHVADDLLARTEAMGWPRFSMLGHSMAGMAMQHVLLAAPERIESLIGVCAVPACGARMGGERWELFHSAVDSVDARAQIIAASTGNRLPRAWSRRLAQQSFASSTRQAFEGYLEAWARTDISARLQASSAPAAVDALLVTGAYDPSLTSRLMHDTWLRWYARASDAVLPGCGHYPMFEAPLALASLIDRFIVDR